MIIRKITPIILIAIAAIAITSSAQAQNNTAAFSAADSSRFSINTNGGWQLYNSYLTQFKPDSVQVELIIQHNNINLQQEQYLGKIKYTAFRPVTAQTIPFSLLSDNYLLRIETNGKCYLKSLSATTATTGPVVLPVKAFYKL